MCRLPDRSRRSRPDSGESSGGRRVSEGSEATEIYIGLGGGGAPDGPRQSLVLKRANRHGLIAGATGIGKTVTLQGLAESLSAVGVAVFVAAVKGDLSGMASTDERRGGNECGRTCKSRWTPYHRKKKQPK